MSIRDKLKKAALLLVELPPNESENPAPSGMANLLDWSRLTAKAEGQTQVAAHGQTKTVEQIV